MDEEAIHVRRMLQDVLNGVANRDHAGTALRRQVHLGEEQSECAAAVAGNDPDEDDLAGGEIDVWSPDRK